MHMTVGIARIAFVIRDSHSLKEKRVVLRRLKDRLKQRFNVSVAEVDDQDVWQRAAIGVATVGQPRKFVEGALDEVLRFARAEVEVTEVQREIATYGDGLRDADYGLGSV